MKILGQELIPQMDYKSFKNGITQLVRNNDSSIFFNTTALRQL